MLTSNYICILLVTAGTTFADWTGTKCTDPAASDAAQDPTYRWKTMDTDTAWAAAVANWKANEGAGGLTFVESISNFFHGPEQMQCDILGISNNCLGVDITCNDKTGPPGTFIINAMKSIASIHNNIYTAVGNSLAPIEADIGNFATTFAPIPPPDETAKILLDLLAVGFAMVAAPMWNIVLKEAPFFKGLSNELGALKDTINPLVTNGITIAKDTSTASQEITVANELAANVKALVGIWGKTIAQMNNDLFNGSDQSIATLQGMMTDGKMIAANLQIAQEDALNTIEKVIYSQIMPQAWSLSPDGYAPFILDTESNCETAIDQPGYISDPNAPNTWSCHNDRIYYLKSIGPPGQVSRGGPDYSHGLAVTGGFLDLPGLGSLGNGNWAGLSISDLVAGSVNTYGNNAWTNLGSDSATLANADGLLANTDAYSSGFVTVPNVITIPVCTGDIAIQNWASTGLYTDGFKRGSPGLEARDGHPAGWPCSTPPDPSTYE